MALTIARFYWFYRIVKVQTNGHTGLVFFLFNFFSILIKCVRVKGGCIDVITNLVYNSTTYFQEKLPQYSFAFIFGKLKCVFYWCLLPPLSLERYKAIIGVKSKCVLCFSSEFWFALCVYVFFSRLFSIYLFILFLFWFLFSIQMLALLLKPTGADNME